MIQAKTYLNFNQETTNIAVGVFSDGQQSLFSQLDNRIKKKLPRMLEENFVSTNELDITPIIALDDDVNTKIYLIGLGKITAYNLEKYRLAIGKIAKETKEDLTILLDTFADKQTSINELAAIAAESIKLATYQFTSYKTEGSNTKSVNFHLYSESIIESDIERGVIYANATNHARSLFNEPGNKLTATKLANSVAQFAQDYDLDYQIMEKEELQERKMGGIIGVNQGSTEPPKVIIANYYGKPQSKEITALIGKGLTFDTGGYCLKSAQGMRMSKGDMGGAASAFGAFEVAVRLLLPINLILVIPSTDNMVSADSLKPGDIIHMMNGKTVEVTNTDAEGRLILGDAITLAKELGASRIIDLATLTGAVAVALGGETTVAFTNNQDFLNQLLNATKLTNEDIWQLPLFPRDQKDLRSSLVADLDNCPVGKPGAIIASAFLKEFVGDTPWIHLDIAGTADTSKDHPLGPKGATGVMVRTLAKCLEMS